MAPQLKAKALMARFCLPAACALLASVLVGCVGPSPDYADQRPFTSPEEAVHAFHDLRGKTFVPMHYGTYDLADEPAGEPVRILDSLQRHDRIHGKLKWLKIGETWHL